MKKNVNYDVIPGLEGMKLFLESNKVAKRVFDQIKTKVYNLINVYNENDVTGVANEVNDVELDFHTGVFLWEYMMSYFALFSNDVQIEVSLFGYKLGEYGFEIIVKK